jgi:hypothetical protein
VILTGASSLSGRRERLKSICLVSLALYCLVIAHDQFTFYLTRAVMTTCVLSSQILGESLLLFSLRSHQDASWPADPVLVIFTQNQGRVNQGKRRLECTSAPTDMLSSWKRDSTNHPNCDILPAISSFKFLRSEVSVTPTSYLGHVAGVSTNSIACYWKQSLLRTRVERVRFLSWNDQV